MYWNIGNNASSNDDTAPGFDLQTILQEKYMLIEKTFSTWSKKMTLKNIQLYLDSLTMKRKRKFSLYKNIKIFISSCIHSINISPVTCNTLALQRSLDEIKIKDKKDDCS